MGEALCGSSGVHHGLRGLSGRPRHGRRIGGGAYRPAADNVASRLEDRLERVEKLAETPDLKHVQQALRKSHPVL